MPVFVFLSLVLQGVFCYTGAIWLTARDKEKPNQGVKMKKLVTVVGVSLIAAVAMMCSASAADTPEKGVEKPKLHTCTGEIVKISSDCIVVKNRNGEQTFAMTDTTKFGTKEDPKKCSDYKAGDKVTVAFKEDGDKKCAVAVRAPRPPKKADETK